MCKISDNSVLLINKPKGITSLDVIRILKNKHSIKKAGHAGTLDPLARGLMIVATGNKTGNLTKLIKLKKEYDADIILGTQTDTGDLDGKITHLCEVPEINPLIIKRCVENIEGSHILPVPFYSAIKYKGKELYKYAREGKQIETPLKEMTVLKARFISYKKPVIKVSLAVTSGTYIRSLAVKLGEMLGTYACIKSLNRTRIGKFKIEDALEI